MDAALSMRGMLCKKHREHAQTTDMAVCNKLYVMQCLVLLHKQSRRIDQLCYYSDEQYTAEFWYDGVVNAKGCLHCMGHNTSHL